MANDPEVAKAYKADYKGKFTPEFVKLVSDHVRNCEQPLTLVDIGGRIDDSNREICRSATHIVILAGDDPKNKEGWNVRMEPWRKFAQELGLIVAAEIFSDYCGKADVVKPIDTDNILHGSVHHLERGESIETRPLIQALASHLCAIAEPSAAETSAELPVAETSAESTYIITLDDAGILRIKFGAPGRNDQLVKDADARLDTMLRTGELGSGGLLKINGPASLPVAMVLAHKVSHLFEAVACFDPKLNKYVVAICHGPNYAVGDLID